MRVGVTDQGAGASDAIVRNRCSTVGSDYIDIEVDEPLTRYAAICASNAVGSVAYRAGEAVVDMARVLCERRVGNDLGEVVTFAAQGIGASHGQVGIGQQVSNGTAR